VQVGKGWERDWEGGKRREGKVKEVVSHPKQKSGCATDLNLSSNVSKNAAALLVLGLRPNDHVTPGFR